jgi:hypothetical protein
MMKGSRPTGIRAMKYAAAVTILVGILLYSAGGASVRQYIWLLVILVAALSFTSFMVILRRQERPTSDPEVAPPQMPMTEAEEVDSPAPSDNPPPVQFEEDSPQSRLFQGVPNQAAEMVFLQEAVDVRYDGPKRIKVEDLCRPSLGKILSGKPMNKPQDQGYSDINLKMTTSMMDAYAGFGAIIGVELQNDNELPIHIERLEVLTDDAHFCEPIEPDARLAPSQSRSFFLKIEELRMGVELRHEVVVSLFYKERGRWRGHDDMTFGSRMNPGMALNKLPKANHIRYCEVNENVMFTEINRKIDLKSVATLATELAEGSGPSLRAYFQAFEWMKKNIAYKREEGYERFQNAAETLTLRTGDCDCQAILLSSIIAAIGGSVRVSVTKAHMFPTIFIGGQDAALMCAEHLQEHYGRTPICFIHDDLGFWLVSDTTTSYMGSFPSDGGPDANGQGLWTCQDGNEHTRVDVIRKPA